MAIAGPGTQLRRWNSTSGTWESIAEINSINGPTISVGTIDTTALDTAGAYRTFTASFIDGGEVTLEMNFTRDTYEQFLTDLNARSLVNYEIVLPDDDTTTFEFEALVVGLPLAVPTDDKITVTVTLKISGQPTLNSGSGPSAAA